MRKHEAIKDIRAFNRFYTNVIGVVDRHILDSPFSLTEARILYELSHGVHVTARRITQFLHVDEGYLSRAIDTLIHQGLIVRKPSRDDRRLIVLRLSAKGRKEFLVLNSRSEKAVESMIMHLSSGQVDDLTSMMRNIRELLSKEQEHDATPRRHSHPKRTRPR